jgi:hypothetical protein
MADIQQLLMMLQSDNPDKRFEACEELRVMPSLPPEAIDALYPLTIAANQDVADAAQRALALHTNASNDVLQSEDVFQVDKKEVGGEAYLIVLGSALLTEIVLVIMLGGAGLRSLLYDDTMTRFILMAIPTFVFSMIAYFVWLRSWRKRKVEWGLKNALSGLIITGFLAGLLPGFCSPILAY